MLPDPVQDTDAEIADHQGHRADRHGQRYIPPVETQAFKRQAKHNGANHPDDTYGRVDQRGKHAGPVQIAPAFLDGLGAGAGNNFRQTQTSTLRGGRPHKRANCGANAGTICQL